MIDRASCEIPVRYEARRSEREPRRGNRSHASTLQRSDLSVESPRPEGMCGSDRHIVSRKWVDDMGHTPCQGENRDSKLVAVQASFVQPCASLP